MSRNASSPFPVSSSTVLLVTLPLSLAREHDQIFNAKKHSNNDFDSSAAGRLGTSKSHHTLAASASRAVRIDSVKLSSIRSQ